MKKNENTKCWWGCKATGVLIPCCKWAMRQPFGKKTSKFPIKLIICLSYDLAISQLGIYPRETETYSFTRRKLFKKSLQHNHLKPATAPVSINRKMVLKVVMSSQNRIICSHKKDQALAHTIMQDKLQEILTLCWEEEVKQKRRAHSRILFTWNCRADKIKLQCKKHQKSFCLGGE